jgi:hypothetical protein
MFQFAGGRAMFASGRMAATRIESARNRFMLVIGMLSGAEIGGIVDGCVGTKSKCGGPSWYIIITVSVQSWPESAIA